MRMGFKRILAALLCVIFCLSLVGCSNAPTWEGKWKITDEDYAQMDIAEVISNEKDGTRYVTLSVGNASFKSEITSDSVRVAAYPLSKADINSATGKEISEELFHEKIVEKVTVDSKDDKSVEISFKEPEYDYFCLYLFYVHKDAVDENRFVMGFEQVFLDEITAPQAEITTKNLKNGMKNPTLELQLSNTNLSEKIEPADIAFSGAFENLEATSVSVKDDKITLETNGEIKASATVSGYVELGSSSTKSGEKILAKTDVENLDLYINAKTFSLENGLLSFDADVFGKTLEMSNEELAALVKIEGNSVQSVKISDDKTSLKIYVKTDKPSLDEAVNSLYGKTLEIGSKAVGGDGITLEITACCASLGGVIKSLEKPDGSSDKFKAAAQLFSRSGELKELSKSDIKFSGDFEGAEIISVKNSENGCDIEFTFTADKDRKIFNGYAEISDNKLFDLWGTASDNNSAGLSYAFETSRANGDAIDNLVEKFTNYSSETLINDIVNIATIIQSVSLSEFYSGDFIGAVFSLLGVDSGSDGETAQILSIVTDIKSMVNNLDCEIKDLRNTVEKYGDEIISETQKNTLLQLESKWNSFNTNYVEKLDKTVNSYISDCRRSLVDYISSEHGSELILYYDEEGKLAIPNKNNTSYSVDAKKIAKTVTIPLDDDTFNSCNAVFGKRGSFAFCDELAAALKTDLGNAVKKLNENGDNSIEYTEKTGEILYGYIFRQISFKHLTSGFLNEIRSDYVNFCKQIYSEQKILDSFDEMMKYKYNFQSEAKQDIENIRNSLVVMLYNYGVMASFAEKYDTSGGNAVTEAAHKALDHIKNDSGLFDEPEGYSYCYVIERPVTLRVSAAEYNMKINFKTRSGASDASPRYTNEWCYLGYEDNGARAFVYVGNSASDTSLHLPLGDFVYPELFEKTTLLSKNILDAKSLKIMEKRFNELKKSNRFVSYKDMTFAYYLTNSGIVKAPSKYLAHNYGSSVNGTVINPTKILTAGVLEKELVLDGSRTLMCNKDGLAVGLLETRNSDLYNERYNQGGGLYFTHGKEYSLTDYSDEEGKATKEYFQIHKEFDATVYDLEKASYINNYVVLQAAIYGESHWYWYCDEAAYFYNTNYREPYFIFPIA